MGRFLAVSASKNNPMKHSFWGTQDVNQRKRAEFSVLPESSRGALLRKVHVLQLPHFFPVFLLKLLGRFVLWSESGRGQMR